MSIDHSADTGSEPVINNTKNEPVIGRNDHHRAKTLQRSVAPWSLVGSRISGDGDAPVGYRRLAAIEEWIYTMSVRRKSKPFYFVYPSFAISELDTSKCSVYNSGLFSEIYRAEKPVFSTKNT